MIGSGVCGTLVGVETDSTGVGVVLDGGCVGKVAFHVDGNRGVAPNMLVDAAEGRSVLKKRTLIDGGK